MRRAKQRLSGADDAFLENLDQKEEATRHRKQYYQLAMATKKASAAVHSPKVKVQEASDKFDAEYKAISDAQDAENIP